jgi:hypothetical protein
MDRIVYMELAGEKYPLLFSMQAFIEICEKYNSLKEAIELMASDKTYQTQFDIAIILSNASADFFKSKKKSVPAITLELLEFGNPFELGGGKLYSAIMDCINAGAKQTVETEENPKNVETARE